MHIDVAVRIGRLPDSALMARRVGEIRWVVCASPDYLSRRGEPRAPADLQGHDFIALEGLQTLSPIWSFASEGATNQLSVTPSFWVNTAEGVIAGAVAGLGVARVMSYQAAASVRDGTLAPIMSDWTPSPLPVPARACRTPTSAAEGTRLLGFCRTSALLIPPHRRAVQIERPCRHRIGSPPSAFACAISAHARRRPIISRL